MSTPATTAIREGARCTSSLLSQLGVDVSPHALEEHSEVLGAALARERWAELVRAHGRAARLVRVSKRTLPRLSLPTVLLRDDAPFCVLRRLRGRRAWIERPDGSQDKVDVDELVDADTCALELDTPLSRLSSLRARIVRRLADERTTVVQLLAMSAWIAGLGLIGPMLTREVMDHALPNRAPQMLLAIAAGIALVGLQRALLSFLREHIVTDLNARNVHALARDGLGHVLGLPYPVLSRVGLGPLLQFLASTEQTSRLLVTMGVRPLLDLMLGLASLALIAMDIPLLALALFVGACAALLVSAYSARTHANHRRAQLDATTRERARLHELIAGIATVKSAGAERHCVERWLAPMLDQSVAGLHADLSASWHNLALAVFSRASRVGVFAWGAIACLSGELSVGTLLQAMMLSESFAVAVTSVSEVLFVLAWIRSDVERVDTLLAQESAPLLAPHAPRTVSAEGDVVVLDDVWFRYGPDQPWILKGYSLRLEAGQQLTLRSASGTGKTTVLRLIAGLLRPERGTVSVLGRDPAEARSQVAYLPQHAHLFAGSLLHNLRLLSGNASLDDIARASHATGLSAFVSSLPMGFETVVPAGGGTLSGGQRQWILLTAALASARPILLMDEALSSLDRLTRARLRQGASFGGKSVIWVSHED